MSLPRGMDPQSNGTGTVIEPTRENVDEIEIRASSESRSKSTEEGNQNTETTEVDPTLEAYIKAKRIETFTEDKGNQKKMIASAKQYIIDERYVFTRFDFCDKKLPILYGRELIESLESNGKIPTVKDLLNLKGKIVFYIEPQFLLDESDLNKEKVNTIKADKDGNITMNLTFKTMREEIKEAAKKQIERLIEGSEGKALRDKVIIETTPIAMTEIIVASPLKTAVAQSPTLRKLVEGNNNSFTLPITGPKDKFSYAVENGTIWVKYYIPATILKRNIAQASLSRFIEVLKENTNKQDVKQSYETQAWNDFKNETFHLDGLGIGTTKQGNTNTATNGVTADTYIFREDFDKCFFKFVGHLGYYKTGEIGDQGSHISPDEIKVAMSELFEKTVELVINTTTGKVGPKNPDDANFVPHIIAKLKQQLENKPTNKSELSADFTFGQNKVKLADASDLSSSGNSYIDQEGVLTIPKSYTFYNLSPAKLNMFATVSKIEGHWEEKIVERPVSLAVFYKRIPKECRTVYIPFPSKKVSGESEENKFKRSSGGDACLKGGATFNVTGTVKYWFDSDTSTHMCSMNDVICSISESGDTTEYRWKGDFEELPIAPILEKGERIIGINGQQTEKITFTSFDATLKADKHNHNAKVEWGGGPKSTPDFDMLKQATGNFQPFFKKLLIHGEDHVYDYTHHGGITGVFKGGGFKGWWFKGKKEKDNTCYTEKKIYMDITPQIPVEIEKAGTLRLTKNNKRYELELLE